MYFFIMGDKPQQCMSPGCSTVNRSQNKVFLLLLVQKNCEPEWHGSRLVIQEDRLFKSPSQIKKKPSQEAYWNNMDKELSFQIHIMMFFDPYEVLPKIRSIS